MPLVRLWFKQAEVLGFTDFKLLKKFQFLKTDIKKWKRMWRGSTNAIRDIVAKEIEVWELLEEERGLSQ